MRCCAAALAGEARRGSRRRTALARDGTFAVAVCAGGDEVTERLRRRRGAADFAWTSEPERL